MLKRQKECIYCKVKKLEVMFQRWNLVVSVVNRLVVTLFGLRNVKYGLIVHVHMCLGRSVYFHVKNSLSVEGVWVIPALHR